MNVIFSLWSRYESSQLSPGDQSAGTRGTGGNPGWRPEASGEKGPLSGPSPVPRAAVAHTEEDNGRLSLCSAPRHVQRALQQARQGRRRRLAQGTPGASARSPSPPEERRRETEWQKSSRGTRGTAGLVSTGIRVLWCVPALGHRPRGGWGREPRVTPPGSAELCLQDSAARREAWKPAFRFARPHGF